MGRDEDILRLSAQVNSSRLVTIVGSGGVGKTTVAVAVGHHLIESFAVAVLFVDLGMLSDPGLVATAIASMLESLFSPTIPRPVWWHFCATGEFS